MALICALERKIWKRKKENGIPAFAGMTGVLVAQAFLSVMPAEAGIPFGSFKKGNGIPAFAGMTAGVGWLREKRKRDPRFRGDDRKKKKETGSLLSRG